jgi:hypothetical protein
MDELQTQKLPGVVEIEIAVLRNGEVVGCSVADFEADGLSTCFPMPDAPVLSIGEFVDVSIFTEGGAVAAARVVSRTDRGCDREYGFEFLHPDVLAESIPTVFERINRRRFARVEPPEESKFAVRLSARKGAVVGQLNDISLGGARIQIARAEEAELSDAVCTHVEISTPYRDIPELSLNGWIRNRRLLDESTTHLGIEFDLSAKRVARPLEKVIERLEQDCRQRNGIENKLRPRTPRYQE